MWAWESGTGDFRAAVYADPAIRQYLSDEKLNEVFSASRQLRHVDAIFDRVFG
jgi:adenylosuccinate lyase